MSRFIKLSALRHTGCARGSLGISLLDFMITLAVISLLASFGVPTARNLLDNQRLQLLQSELVTHLNLARHTAVHQSRSIVICPSNDGLICLPQPAWETGWIVFLDRNRDHRRSEDEAIIRVAQGRDWANIKSGARKYFRFRFDGTASGSNGSLRICDQRGADYGWRLIISTTGRIRSEGPGIDRC